MAGAALGRCLRTCFDALLRPLTDGRDSESFLYAKSVIVRVTALVLPAAVLFALQRRGSLAATGPALTVATICLVPHIGWRVAPRARLELVVLAGALVAIAWTDYLQLRIGDRTWSMGVIIVDMALVMNVEGKFTAMLVTGFVTYFAFASVDRLWFRLYAHTGSDGPWICECADPPCRIPLTEVTTDTFQTFFIFLTDFYLTRGFAEGMRRQRNVVQRAIEVTEQIAQHLSLYAVEEGRALLDGGEGDSLPPVLEAALYTLLDNLEEYKPYLPDSLLFREVGEDVGTAEPPGLGQEDAKVTMCFTDIQSSTELWERYPQSMYHALVTHNDAVRGVAKGCSGYEVKVIGDAFMLAFKSAEEACRFGLDVQVALAEAKWPSELLQHPLCRPTVGGGGDIVWCGPRVRVGLHCGEVRVEKNPVTGRCDYFGPTVNVASRVEASLRNGGVTGVTQAVLGELTSAALSRLGSPVQIPLGERSLKGVQGAVELTVLLRPELVDRKAVLRSAPDAARRGVWESPRESRVWVPRSSTGSPTDDDSRGPQRQRCTLTRRDVVSCATFRVRTQSDLVDLGAQAASMIEAVEYAADATQGVVTGTTSGQAVVVWNGPRSCHDLHAQCLRALDIMRQACAVAAGACSGEALYGNVAAGRRKYSTVVGGCVELSGALAEAAERARQPALVAATFGMYCTTQERTRRHAELAVEGWASPLLVWSLSEPRERGWAEAEPMADPQTDVHVSEHAPQCLPLLLSCRPEFYLRT